uniref:progestin and adipoQ receptor family member 3-like isoform X2 n=1 Tax=Gasterosteus aculeatus aculeatus TaxID=481459 RepID=UPI001A98D65E|nr:progestin and adipoQ receptor family member 3-like isoform X2 [Gasterosteus aculeatus aculeatus]
MKRRVLGGQPVAEKKKKQQQEEKKEEEKMLLKTPQKLLKTGHYIELGSYQHWPVLIPQRIRLYTYEQIPLFLKENPFITGGYRAHLPSKLCLRSIFMLTNETVNIWSHLLGFLLFFSLGVNDVSSVLPASGANREDYVIYVIGLFCFQVCMLCSVGYHLFSCHRSETTCRRWLSLDYAGISVGILGCYVPGIFYAFYCNAVHPHYLSNEWRGIRTTIFCCVAGISVIPACHWVWLNGGLATDVVQLFLPRVLVMYLIAGAAFLFYVTKVPERYFPGQLNYLGASHQVWHILVVVMFYWWHQTAVHIMHFRHSRSCPSSSS